MNDDAAPEPVIEEPPTRPVIIDRCRGPYERSMLEAFWKLGDPSLKAWKEGT